MLLLESQKKDLEITLRREPTVEEWANHCGTSIFKLYARYGHEKLEVVDTNTAVKEFDKYLMGSPSGEEDLFYILKKRQAAWLVSP
jgi:hypothetical protein